jgi:hypothetical protein
MTGQLPTPDDERDGGSSGSAAQAARGRAAQAARFLDLTRSRHEQIVADLDEPDDDQDMTSSS